MLELSMSIKSVLRVLLSAILYGIFKKIARVIWFPSPLRGIPGPRSQSWVMGNLKQLFNAKGVPFHNSLVEDYGGVAKVHGFFGDEQLYITDPRALHSIVIRDQDAFEETPSFIQNNLLIFGPGLVSTIGDQHKRQRKIANPVFAVPHLRKLMPIFYEVAERCSDVISKESDHQLNGVVDMADWMSRVALETVGQTILGYSFDPLDSPYNNHYTSAIKELIPTLFKLSIVRQFVPRLIHIGSPEFRRKVVDIIPVSSIQAVKGMSDVMYDTAKSILVNKQRDASVTKDSNERDVISVLLRANSKVSPEEQMNEDELIGQITVLIFGAQDTSSSSLSRLLYMLATNTGIQDRLRTEISKADQDGDGRLPYEALMELPLLDAVLKETLRLHPPVPFVRRTTLKERAIPLTPATAANLPSHIQATSSLTIPVGTTLFVNLAGANRLENVWGSDAKQWKPERWLSGDKEALKGEEKLPGIYSGMLTFYGGERACIGYKFAQIEIKVLLVTLLSRFKFSLPSKDGVDSGEDIVWNLSQILSPSVRSRNGEERKGLPLVVRKLD